MTTTPLDFKQLPEETPKDLSQVPIGLALSGGGYRAAAFHLGTLAYLERIKLLTQLSRLSTVSGGTFTGSKYILSLVEGIGFLEFFQNFYRFLRDQNLFKAGLADLSQGPSRVPSGQPKLILSMANVYADTFLKSPQGHPYTLGEILDSEISVKEISFNTTEFRTGVAFRFQKSANSRARIGNGNVSIPRDAAKEIRLADIVAASSCFPGGFEPLEFPQDFAWPNNQIPSRVKDAVGKNGQFHSLALMDGGIFDNQGIDSLLLSDSRNDSESLGLFIISDVDSLQDSLYEYPQNDKPSGNLTLGQLDWFIRFFLLICILTVVSVSYELWREIQQGTFIFWQHFFSVLMPLILAFGVIASLWWGRGLIKNQLLPRIPQAGLAGWQDLKLLKVDEFLYLVELRMTSLLALTSAVFMDRIKALIFARVYSDKRYQGKRISNRIDRLVKSNVSLPGVTPLSSTLKQVSENAAAMPTTLWFDNPQQLADVTVTGQATICFNLMQYICRAYKDSPENYPPAVRELWDELNQDWERLNINPYDLLEELMPEEKLLRH